jgi:hypothetical protein
MDLASGCSLEFKIIQDKNISPYNKTIIEVVMKEHSREGLHLQEESRSAAPRGNFLLRDLDESLRMTPRAI